MPKRSSSKPPIESRRKRWTNFWHFVSRLRKAFPERKVYIRFVKEIEGAYADTLEWKEGYRIRMTSDEHVVNIDYALELLIHEWAHVLSYEFQDKDHGTAWSDAYRRIYAVYEKWASE